MKKLGSILAVVLVLAMVLAMAPAVFAAECHLVDGTSYKIVANNKNGPMYFKGTITDGRWDCSASEADAAAVYAEAVTGGWKLYVKDGETKKYIKMDDKSQGAKFEVATGASVFTWNATLNTLVESDPDNARSFGCDPTKTYLNYSCYATTGSSASNYNWGQFVAYAPVQDTREELPTAVADIVAAIYALTDGETLDKYYKYESFTLSGVVDGDTTWNDQYGDGQVTFKVDGTDKELLAYQFKAGSIDAAVAKALATGDKVTFTVTEAKNYSGTFEIVKATLTAVEKAQTPSTSAPAGTTGATQGTAAPDKVGDNTGIVSMTAVMLLAVTALAALVIGNKKRNY